MSKKKKTCPACGSENIKEYKSSHHVNEAFGGGNDIAIIEDTCQNCETTGDFFSQNDVLISEAIDHLKSLAARNILQDFANNSISMSSMERALGLPQRTLTKWKNGQTKPSSAGLALLKMLRIFPWLLDVAEQKFDYQSGQHIFMQEAMSKFVRHISFHDQFGNHQKITTSAQMVVINISNQYLPDHNNFPQTEGNPQFALPDACWSAQY